MTFARELTHALRRLIHAPGFSATVILTLGLGIGANAAIFSVARGILLTPLPNDDEARLIYLRQSAAGIGADNAYFSVPEIADYRSRLESISALGEFSTITFTMVGLGEPRQVRAGVVDGDYFAVMGLRPVLGRLLGPGDDGPDAAGAAVLTHRFWAGSTGADPAVVGRTIRLGSRTATIVGVLEPAVPYPTETELIANVVTSPHHLSAVMTTDRQHRMTELFGRLAAGASLDAAKAELAAVQRAMLADHPEAYAERADFRITARRLRDQIADRARTTLLVLLGAAGLVFVIACANVANLIVARAIRREPEMAVRAALGASPDRLRLAVFAECLLLSLAGAATAVLIAGPVVRLLVGYAARLSPRASDVTVDASLLWVAVALSVAAAVGFAFLPGLGPVQGPGVGVRTSTGRTKRRQRAFAVAQVAASFVLLAAAGLLLRTLLALQATPPGFETVDVLAVNVPVTTYGRTLGEVRQFYEELQRRVSVLPGVRSVAVGSAVPWRDTQGFGADFAFRIGGAIVDTSGEDPRANFRSVSPGFFATLGIPIVDGRDFTEADRAGADRVVVVSESIARRLFPGQPAIGRDVRWTDGRMRFIGVSTEPRRIVGVAADVRDEAIAAAPEMTVYHPFQQELGGGRLFVHARDPYPLVPAITKIVRELAADQPVEQARTLQDIRAEVLAPSRLNAVVVGGFAAVAAMIAVVGVAGLLAFSVSGRTREFGIRLALGSRPRDLLVRVLIEGAWIAGAGIAAGFVAALVLTQLLTGMLHDLQPRDPISLAVSSIALAAATIAGAAGPAVRASRVDVLEALRME
jgi:predicted permease